MVHGAIPEALAEFRRDAVRQQTERLRAELRAVDERCRPLPALLEQLEAQESQRQELRSALVSPRRG